ncbi:hypothetical protein D1007_40688 [Hordeum vulgare]|nr:hypothetical protein D1007_40688 [Hordeum vulgare]
MRVDPQILEKHLAVEATVDASRVVITTWLAALQNNSLFFLEGSTRVFDDDYKLFSQRAHALVNSRAGRLVLEHVEATHHYKKGTHDVKASPSSKSIIVDISNNEE